jgi:hypothetical protein
VVPGSLPLHSLGLTGLDLGANLLMRDLFANDSAARTPTLPAACCISLPFCRPDGRCERCAATVAASPPVRHTQLADPPSAGVSPFTPEAPSRGSRRLCAPAPDAADCCMPSRLQTKHARPAESRHRHARGGAARVLLVGGPDPMLVTRPGTGLYRWSLSWRAGNERIPPRMCAYPYTCDGGI